MTTIWLRYKNLSGPPVSLRLQALACYPKDTVSSEIIRTLREEDVEHVMSKRVAYDIVIGANELADPDRYAFVRAFWTAPSGKWIAIADSEDVPDDTSFVPVTTPGGDLPVEFEEGHKGLPTWSATLTEKSARPYT